MEKMGDTDGVGLIVYTGTREDLQRKLRERDDKITELERLIYVYCDPMAMPDDDAKIAKEIAARMSGSQ